MAIAYSMLAQESSAASGILGIVISTLGTIIVGLLTFLAARSTKPRDEKKNIPTGDYMLKNLDLAAQVTWKPISEEEWTRKLTRMKRVRVALVVIFLAAFLLAQISFFTGSPWSFLSSIPTVVLILIAVAAELGWIMLNQAVHMSEEKTAAEASAYELELLVQGSRQDILSRCVAAMRKIDHSVAAVDVQPTATRLVSVGDYGQELLRIDLSLESRTEFRVRIRSTRRASFSSFRKTRRCVLRLVEQLTGYPLYNSPPAKADGTPLEVAAAVGDPVIDVTEDRGGSKVSAGNPGPKTNP